MEPRLKRILTGVANNTLEKLAFLFAFPDDDRDHDGPEPAVIGGVNYNGYFGGTLLMRISASAIPELANNMLGLEDDADICDTEQQDALKELLNVICGNALPAIAGDQVEFTIEAPEILTPNTGENLIKKGQPACVVRLMLEEGFCDLFLFVRGEIPELKANFGTGQNQ